MATTYLRIWVVQYLLTSRYAVHSGSEFHQVEADCVFDPLCVPGDSVDGRIEQRLVTKPSHLPKKC